MWAASHYQLPLLLLGRSVNRVHEQSGLKNQIRYENWQSLGALSWLSPNRTVALVNLPLRTNCSSMDEAPWSNQRCKDLWAVHSAAAAAAFVQFARSAPNSASAHPASVCDVDKRMAIRCVEGGGRSVRSVAFFLFLYLNLLLFLASRDLASFIIIKSSSNSNSKWNSSQKLLPVSEFF